MNRVSRALLSLLALSLAGGAMTGCSSDSNDTTASSSGGGGLPAGAAAKVGTRTITDAAVRAQMDASYQPLGGTAKSFGPPNYRSCVTAKTGSAPRPGETAADIHDQCRAEFEIAHAQAVNTLVRNEWLAREAKRQGINTQPDIKKALKLRRGFEALANRHADPPPNYLADVRTRARQDKLMAAIPLTERAIADYANANGDVFLDSETRIANFLQTNTKHKAELARKALEHGTPWPQILARYRVKQWEAHDWHGTEHITKASAPQDAIGRALFTTKPHKLTGPIHTLNGWFLFQINTIKPPAHKTLTTKARAAVTTTLRAHQLDQNLHNHYANQTTCAPQYQVPEAPQCQQNPAEH